MEVTPNCLCAKFWPAKHEYTHKATWDQMFTTGITVKIQQWDQWDLTSLSLGRLERIHFDLDTTQVAKHLILSALWCKVSCTHPKWLCQISLQHFLVRTALQWSWNDTAGKLFSWPLPSNIVTRSTSHISHSPVSCDLSVYRMVIRTRKSAQKSNLMAAILQEH